MEKKNQRLFPGTAFVVKKNSESADADKNSRIKNDFDILEYEQDLYGPPPQILYGPGPRSDYPDDEDDDETGPEEPMAPVYGPPKWLRRKKS